MISLQIIFTLLFLHWISDFIFQSDYVAKNKSKSNKILLQHIVTYTIPFILLISPLYGLINGILHFGIDYFTSRLTGKLWAAGEVHWFFVIIGLDQLLHYISLFGTYYLLF